MSGGSVPECECCECCRIDHRVNNGGECDGLCDKELEPCDCE